MVFKGSNFAFDLASFAHLREDYIVIHLFTSIRIALNATSLPITMCLPQTAFVILHCVQVHLHRRLPEVALCLAWLGTGTAITVRFLPG